MAITTEQIKELREATGAGILDCRKALEQADGDFDKAVDYPARKGSGHGRQARRPGGLRRRGRTVLARQRPRGRDGGSQLRDRFRRPLRSLPHLRPRAGPADCRRRPALHQRRRYPGRGARARARDRRAPRPAKKASPKRCSSASSKAAWRSSRTKSVLLRQPYIRDESITIEKLLNAERRRHRRKHRHPALCPLGTGREASK